MSLDRLCDISSLPRAPPRSSTSRSREWPRATDSASEPRCACPYPTAHYGAGRSGRSPWPFRCNSISARSAARTTPPLLGQRWIVEVAVAEDGLFVCWPMARESQELGAFCPSVDVFDLGTLVQPRLDIADKYGQRVQVRAESDPTSQSSLNERRAATKEVVRDQITRLTKCRNRGRCQPRRKPCWVAIILVGRSRATRAERNRRPADSGVPKPHERFGPDRVRCHRGRDWRNEIRSARRNRHPRPTF